MLFMVATNVVASRPAERQPTRTPTARANIVDITKWVKHSNSNIIYMGKDITTRGCTRAKLHFLFSQNWTKSHIKHYMMGIVLWMADDHPWDDGFLSWVQQHSSNVSTSK